MTNSKIAEQWKEIDLKVSTINNGEIFYTGFPFDEKLGKTEEQFLDSRYAIWMTKHLPIAGHYSYRGMVDLSRKIAKIEISSEIKVLEFPPRFHPASCFYEWQLVNGEFKINHSKPRADMAFEGWQPDHHIDKYFKEITSLIDLDENITGYIRRADTEDTDHRPGEIKEFALIDKNYKRIISIANLPKELKQFQNIVATSNQNLERKIFS
jgi:hypothetical protein